jgi:putative membrane protein
MMSGWGTGFHWWAWLLGIGTTAVFWALVIWAIVALVRWARHDGNGPANPGRPGAPGETRDAGDRGDDAPGRTLARRYAAGEIDAGEYSRRVAAPGR